MTDEFTTPPHDDGAERALLGAVLCGGRALSEVAGQIRPEDFYSPKHGQVFAAVLAVLNAGDPVDPVTVLAELGRRSTAARTTAGPMLAELVEQAPIGGQVGWYAARVADCAGKRKVLIAAQRIAQIALSGQGSAAETGEAARQILDAAVASTTVDGEGVVMAADLVTEGLARYQSTATPAVTTGLYDLDEAFTGGLRPGCLYVVAARPGVGKSLLACVMAANIAKSAGAVFFASLEMNRGELFDRLVARLGKVELSHLTRQEFIHDDWDRAFKAAGLIEKWPLGVLDTPNVGLTTIRAQARDMTRLPGGLALVVVDYLQLIRPADPRQPREQQVASFSRGLKLLAKELSVPVVALAQVNRAPETRADRRPALGDLRESGAIEADADAVLLLHDDQDPTTAGVLDVIIAKNRHGRRGQLQLSWEPQYARAESLDPRMPAEGVA